MEAGESRIQQDKSRYVYQKLISRQIQDVKQNKTKLGRNRVNQQHMDTSKSGRANNVTTGREQNPEIQTQYNGLATSENITTLRKHNGEQGQLKQCRCLTTGENNQKSGSAGECWDMGSLEAMSVRGCMCVNVSRALLQTFFEIFSNE